MRQLDVTVHETRLRALDEIATEFGAVDILINNAGVGIVGSLEQLDDAALQAQRLSSSPRKGSARRSPRQRQQRLLSTARITA